MKRKRVVQDMHVTADHPVGFVVGGFEFTPAPPLVPNIRCTATPPCGFCWYCREHAKVNA